MPIRNMLYDAISYVQQISEISRKHRQKGIQLSKAEFLSGLTKEDRLIPVVTLVVYWGQEEWDAPCSLYEMLECADTEVLSCINDYRINLVNPHWMESKDFEKVGESLAVVMRFMKASVSEEDMKKLLQEHTVKYSNIEQDAAEVIRACAKIEIAVDEKGEVVDVCKAWDEHWESGRELGIKQGKEQGIKSGIDKQIVASVRAIMDSLDVSLEAACNILKIKVSEYERAKVIWGRITSQ